jgi:hypothetical protein
VWGARAPLRLRSGIALADDGEHGQPRPAAPPR